MTDDALRPPQKTVLLVEDTPSSRRMLELLLQTGGFAVEVADSLEALAEQLARRRFDVMLLDLTLGDASVNDLLDSLEPLPDRPPTIIYSGWGEEVLIPAAKRLQAVAWLRKPVKLEELSRAVERAVARDPQ